jgi:hypothetical protein
MDTVKTRVFRVMSRQESRPGNPKGEELSVREQFINSIFASARVIVKHTISGVKCCRIVKDVLRLTKEGISDRVIEWSASIGGARGLVNCVDTATHQGC